MIVISTRYLKTFFFLSRSFAIFSLFLNLKGICSLVSRWSRVETEEMVHRRDTLYGIVYILVRLCFTVFGLQFIKHLMFFVLGFFSVLFCSFCTQ